MVASEENTLSVASTQDVEAEGMPHVTDRDDRESNSSLVIRSRHHSNISHNNPTDGVPPGKGTPSPLLMNGTVVPKDKNESPNTAKKSIHSRKSIQSVPVKSKKEKFRDYVTLLILLLANLINYMDRYTIAGVLEDVQKFYNINNAQAGLLQTSFIVSYMLLSPIFGYIGDRYNRKWAMAGGIFFWSLVTFAGSFVPSDNFILFLFLRAMVGVGEASYSTIAPTIIADMFSRSVRTRALSIFYFAIPVGSGLGYIVGSKVAALAGAWNWSLRVTPALGLCCTLAVIFVVVEPSRGASDGGTHLKSTSFIEDLKYLMKHKSFLLSTFGFTCVAFVAGALALWAPLYVYRAAKLNDPTVEMAPMSLIFGVITCLAGLCGVLVGYFSALKLRQYTRGADPIICAVGLIGGAPFLFCSLVLANQSIALTWVLIFISELLLSLNWALVTDILLYTVIPTRRSSAEAIQILVSHALGDAGSPYLVGLISDAIEEGHTNQGLLMQYLSLQYALYMTCFVSVIGGGFFFANSLFVHQDKRNADSWIKQSNESKNSKNTSGSSFTAELVFPSSTDSTQDIPESDNFLDDVHDKSLTSLDSGHVIMIGNSKISDDKSTHL